MKIREIASGLHFPEGPIAMDDGSILLVEIAGGTLTRVSADGKVQRLVELGGGPNGAALAPDGSVIICNNGGMQFTSLDDGTLRPGHEPADYSGGRIERVDLATKRVERLFDAVEGERLKGPNDIVFDKHGGFYFTDLGKARPHNLDWGGVFYAPGIRAEPKAVAYPVMTANGVALSPDGATLYYAETEGARLWAFDIESPGCVRREPWPSMQGGRLVAAAPGGQYQRFDSMAVDVLGNLYIGTLLHGGITIISPDGLICKHLPLPDRYPTNMCFGGPDMRTLYVTLSASGRLIAIDDWPVPGLRLN
ncbi:SMP-30/gluconolactonase/LRE family protein [Paralcaligenes sp. KSB-10]|uniref:SMP-30/gluconolactonase/LRE family protein n=1 Tax=Paralcaligenes sp. KSB-10 TaxID=2901142 RepID=UPI001E56065C|nr:SMP-30/gluconolactonase/LRE family protein [Paralcaligenes sp. KSB-10]UHL64054.1 SMP-30/gluconolactonase/LRE family protein [Paralcaligenes sp. KSB-10]